MNDIFLAVTLAGLLGIVVALIRPRTFGMTRAKGLLVTVAVVLVGFVSFGTTIPPKDASPPALAVAPVAPPPATPPVLPKSPAAAEARPRQPETLTSPDGGNLLIWRDSNAQSEGLRLINAGVNRTQPQMIVRLLSCVVASGSQIVVTDGGFFSSTVLVVSGRETGCRGVVANERISRPD
ncbi:hypothetical protein [Falsiroseomonas sp.]|uniref:hypothetical protein n=1 Tax=Falsiroseomonas sp. TaxID=2870721 RepID=UPI002720B185|nr:hypothetical protein [Falsiroseomonas sp.]MDO9499018.1 hypothetical protein [Falsiroseomonas sp.]